MLQLVFGAGLLLTVPLKTIGKAGLAYQRAAQDNATWRQSSSSLLRIFIHYYQLLVFFALTRQPGISKETGRIDTYARGTYRRLQNLLSYIFASYASVTAVFPDWRMALGLPLLTFTGICTYLPPDRPLLEEWLCARLIYEAASCTHVLVEFR